MAVMGQSINAYYQNVRGLRTKTNEFLKELQLTSYDLICLTETWLWDGISSAEIFSSNYSVFRKDRDYSSRGCRFGGGVLIATSSAFQAHRRYDLETYDECVWLQMECGNGQSLLVGNYYFQPMSDVDTLSTLMI